MKAQIIVTEQYPKALGHTVPELLEELEGAEPAHHVVEKTLFSMCVPDVVATLKSSGIRSVVIMGGETHVCVLQTAMDLLRMGIQPYVVADAVSSQRPVRVGQPWCGVLPVFVWFFV